MDRRFLTVLGVSLVFALVVSSIFYQINARAGASAPKAQTPQDLKDVVVAARPLSVGVTVKPGDIKYVKISAEAFPKGAFSKDTDVLDRPVASSILADEPVLEGRLASRGAGVGLAPIIPPGMRAVTVRVNDVTGVAGFVLPNMRVDVLVTGRPPNGDNTVTQTVLQNVLVLSAGQNLQADARGQAISAPTVTLLADPKQAEVLTLANSEGHIQLILRNGSDQDITVTPGRKVQDLFKTGGFKTSPSVTAGAGNRPSDDESESPRPRPRPRPVQAVAASVPASPSVAAPPPPAPPDQVVVIRGTTKTVEVVRPSSQQ
jgi:pilus assembly protein CpaB